MVKPIKHKLTRKNKIVPDETRCNAICRSGKRCKKPAQIDSDYCATHNTSNTDAIINDSMPMNISDPVPVTKNKCFGSNCAIMGGIRSRRRY